LLAVAPIYFMLSGQNNLFQVVWVFFFIINIFVTILLQHLGF